MIKKISNKRSYTVFTVGQLLECSNRIMVGSILTSNYQMKSVSSFLLGQLTDSLLMMCGEILNQIPAASLQ